MSEVKIFGIRTAYVCCTNYTDWARTHHFNRISNCKGGKGKIVVIYAAKMKDEWTTRRARMVAIE